MTIGVSVVTFGRPKVLLECLAALQRSTVVPDRIILWDNSAERWKEPPDAVEYAWTGQNVGLPAAIGECWRRLRDVDHILVLDDDTVLEPVTIAHMLALLGPGVGAVTHPTPTTVASQGDLPTKTLFPWSPTLLSRQAIDASGEPMAELFFGWDDWEYATRVHLAGFEIVWVPDVLPKQKLHRPWLGRAYLNSRNAVYLVSRRKVREPYLRREAIMALKSAIRGSSPRAAVIRRGVLDGLVGRLGAPPDDLAPSEHAARAHD